MYPSEVTALLRNILDETCLKVPVSATEQRAFVASKLLECAASGHVSAERLRAAGRIALHESSTRHPSRSIRSAA
jgi:7,8-dihydro-6-hydroxymethylpterin-pyrophosphokinase